MKVYFKVLGSQCHYSMCYCCRIPEIYAFVPKLCRAIIYQGKHDRLSKTSTLHCSRSAPKNLRVFQLLNYLSSASCDQLCCIGISLYDTYPHAVVPQLCYIATTGNILSAPSRDTTVQVYRYSFHHNC